MNIEKKLNQIWIGPNKPPLQWMHTWKDKHPDWEYSIFDDSMLHNRKWHNQHLIDMTCLENTDELFTAPKDHAYSCYENERGRHNFIQPIMACNPGNAFVKHIIDTLHILTPNELSPEPFRSTGNLFLSRHVPHWMHQLTVWPSHYFIPLFYIGGAKRYDGPDKVYADHKWGSTGHANSVAYSKGV
jgi:hypothetical protein